MYDEWMRLFPNVTPFYAVKCNSDPVLVKVLAELGAGFDCASKVYSDTIVGHLLSKSTWGIYVILTQSTKCYRGQNYTSPIQCAYIHT